jgi:hypothetical protein
MDNVEHVLVKTSIWDTVLTKAKQAYKTKGLNYVIKMGFRMALDIPMNRFWLWHYRTFRSSETFEFQGKTYPYLIHPYCASWKNERAVNIPVVWDIVKTYQENGKRILEVGNMLSYVYPISHDVLDKYEVIDGIINEDVVSFHPSTKYDLIFSILSLQCVGWDETPREPTKILDAIDNLKSLLAPGGQLVVSLGIGYNHAMDEMLKNETLSFERQYYLKRLSKCKWKEATWDEVKDLDYDHFIPSSIGIVIGMYEMQK